MTAKVLWHVTMSLDGFIAGPNDAMEWAFERATVPSAEAQTVIASTGAILAGRRWWDAAAAKYNGLDGIYGGAWKGPVLVLTHGRAPAPRDARLTFFSKRIAEAVPRALQAARGKDVVVLGANVAQQCLGEHLLDEVLVHVAPVLLGDGVRLIAERSISKTDLELVRLGRAGQITEMRYRVHKGQTAR